MNTLVHRGDSMPSGRRCERSWLDEQDADQDAETKRVRGEDSEQIVRVTSNGIDLEARPRCAELLAEQPTSFSMSVASLQFRRR